MYIRGIGNVSPLLTGLNRLPEQVAAPDGEVLRCTEPDYTAYIDSRQLRRMARIIKMSVAASAMAIKDAGVEQPDAIITATGLGCIEDTQEFLKSLITDKETLLSPTSFIKSTHNTIGGQIALLQNCNGYNMTYAHHNFSFESALLDSQLLLKEGETETVLTGGIDELTTESIKLLQRLGCINERAKGGEGAVFFVLADKPDTGNYASIEKISASYNDSAEEAISSFFKDASIGLEDIDVVLTDEAGLFPGKPVLNYKQFSGVYHTASAFATLLGAMVLKEQRLPEWLASAPPEKLENILIYNRSGSNGHSFILLKRC